MVAIFLKIVCDFCLIFGAIDQYFYLLTNIVSCISWIGLFVIFCKICSISFHEDRPLVSGGILTSQTYTQVPYQTIVYNQPQQ